MITGFISLSLKCTICNNYSHTITKKFHLSIKPYLTNFYMKNEFYYVYLLNEDYKMMKMHFYNEKKSLISFK